MSAFRALKERHVFDDPQNRDVHFLEHAQPLLGIKKRNVLRRRHDDRPRHRHGLRERELNVARSRRHVDHEVVKVMPRSLRQKLRQGLRHQGAAPDHRFSRIHHEAHGIDFQTVTHDGFHVDAVQTFGATFGGKHRGLRGPVNIRVQHPHLGTFFLKSQREVCGDRGLTDAALAGTHGNDVLHIGQSFQHALHAVRTDFPGDGHFRFFNAGCRKRRLHRGLNFRGRRLHGIPRRHMHCDRTVLFRHGLHGLQINQGLAADGVGDGFDDFTYFFQVHSSYPVGKIRECRRSRGTQYNESLSSKYLTFRQVFIDS